MRTFVLTFILIMQLPWFVRATTIRANSPASELAAALADAEQLHPHDRATTRYLSLYSVPADRRDEVAAVAGYTLNALSRSRAIVEPKWITDTLLRFNIQHYTTIKTE